MVSDESYSVIESFEIDSLERRSDLEGVLDDLQDGSVKLAIVDRSSLASLPPGEMERIVEGEHAVVGLTMSVRELRTGDVQGSPTPVEQLGPDDPRAPWAAQSSGPYHYFAFSASSIDADSSTTVSEQGIRPIESSDGEEVLKETVQQLLDDQGATW